MHKVGKGMKEGEKRKRHLHENGRRGGGKGGREEGVGEEEGNFYMGEMEEGGT